MEINKPWYSFENIKNTLLSNNFELSPKEKLEVVMKYSKFINFFSQEYNYENIKKMGYYIDFMIDDYDNENLINEYVSFFLSGNMVLYSLPLVFEISDFKSILNEFKPSLIAKINGNFSEYLKCLNSLVSDYSGEFILFYEDFSSFLIVNQGNYYVRGVLGYDGEINNDSWNKLADGKIEVYEYNKKILLPFKN